MKAPQFGPQARAEASRNHISQEQRQLLDTIEAALPAGYYRVKHPSGGRWLICRWRPSDNQWVHNNNSELRPPGFWSEIGEKVA